MRCEAGIGAKASLERQSYNSTSRIDLLSKSHIPRSRIRTWLARTRLLLSLLFPRMVMTRARTAHWGVLVERERRLVVVKTSLLRCDSISRCHYEEGGSRGRGCGE